MFFLIWLAALARFARSAASFHVKLVRERTRSYRQKMFHVKLARSARSL